MLALPLLLAQQDQGGCQQQADTDYQVKGGRNQHTVRLVEIDECEYLILDESYQQSVMSHKGNCKYCMERLGAARHIRPEKETGTFR
jgi:hypothetical protein